jgi:RNA polymerase sigma factor (sigma-70 family)
MSDPNRSDPNRSDRSARPAETEIPRLVLAAKAGDEDATAKLVAEFTPAIRGVSRRYCRWPALNQSELLQEGVVGLLRAVDRFDASLGTPFWAYAAWWVRQAMQRLVAELNGAVVLSDRAMRQLVRIKAAQRDYRCNHGLQPTARDLAGMTGLGVDHVGHLLTAERRPRGLKERVREDAGSTMTFEDLVADPTAEDAYEDAPSRLAPGEVEHLLDHLTARERRVIRARYGLDLPERTLREVGADLRISAERVRQIQEQALGKLRGAAAEQAAV